LSVSIGISVTFFISSKLRETITSGVGCEILFRKPKRIKDLVKSKKKEGEMEATGGKFKNLSEG